MVDRSEASPTVVSVAPERVDAVDLAIGLPTAGDGVKLQAAVGIVQEAMTTHLAGLSAAILHVDAALPDEQVGRVDPVADGIRVMHERPAKMLSSKDGLEVWSEAVRTVLGAARTLQARVVIVLNSSMASMTPEWIRGLAQPVLKDGCAFVLPIYARGRYDGTLTQVFVAPLMRALFGHQFWYPMADEFGCSADVAEFLLAQDIWDTDLARQGLEFWLPVAVTGGAISSRNRCWARASSPAEARSLLLAPRSAASPARSSPSPSATSPPGSTCVARSRWRSSALRPLPPAVPRASTPSACSTVFVRASET